MTRDEDDATIPIMNNNSNIMQTKIQRKGHKQQQQPQQQQQHQRPRPTHGRVKLEEEPGAGECLTNPDIVSSTTAATVPSTLPSNPSNPASPSRSTNLDGIGLWNSFTRNFATPIQATFDLLDNSFDAAPLRNGHIHIETDLDDEREARGVVILNNCSEPIGSLKHALTLFKSSKGEKSHMDKIGENGVGVKQGCATLSDLSFIICRDHSKFGLGIVAKDLQTRNGICFPSFSFNWEDSKGELVDWLQSEIDSIFSSNSLQGIITTYGDGDRAKGVQQLVKHYKKITNGIWNAPDVHHVFGLIIHDLRHGPGWGEDGEDSDDEDDIDKTIHFLSQLEKEIPKHYLHVPQTFDMQVNQRQLSFSYWPNRLADMTEFTVHIDKNVSCSNSKDLLFLQPPPSPDSTCRYNLKVYIGFDVMRFFEPTANRAANLLFHSRRTGRLIKTYRDARSELFLPAGKLKVSDEHYFMSNVYWAL